MSRLIDADALILHFNDWALSASPTGRESVKESTLKLNEYDTIETAIEGIAHAPTVPAIPVDWIEWRIAHAEREGFGAVVSMLRTVRDWWNDQRDVWEREQGAR